MCKGSAETRVAIRLTEKKKKNVLVSRLNHSFNLTGCHKKSAPYADKHTHTHTNAHIDRHTQACTQRVRTKTTLKSYLATRCFSQIPDYNTNGAVLACLCVSGREREPDSFKSGKNESPSSNSNGAACTFRNETNRFIFHTRMHIRKTQIHVSK